MSSKKSSLDTYAKALREAELITKQDAKDIEDIKAVKGISGK